MTEQVTKGNVRCGAMRFRVDSGREQRAPRGSVLSIPISPTMQRFAACLLVVCAACARPAATPIPAAPPARTPAARSAPTQSGSAISADALRRDLSIFASDSFRGRSALTHDGTRAARFIAERLRELGVEPAGDSDYLQRVPLMRRTIAPTTRLQVMTPEGTATLPFGERLIAVPTIGEGIPLPRLQAEGDVVFAGYALSLPPGARGSDASLDLAGKTVVFVDELPPWLSPERRAGIDRAEMLGERLRALAERDPAAIVVLFGPDDVDQFATMAAELQDSSLAPGTPPPADAPRPLPMMMFGLAHEGSPLLPRAWPRDDRPQPIVGHRFRGRLDLAYTEYPTYNVVGIIRGRDTTLDRTYVAFGAHLDHLGVVPAVRGDSIANGADDDGSGSVALLAIARKFMSSPVRPRRSLLFVWHTAEEEGLFGSAYFTAHPTVPLDSIVAQLNADMIGRNAPDSLYIVGPRAAPQGQSRALGAIVDSVNAALPHPFHFDRSWDSLTSPEQMYYRSDQYNYAKCGIPIVFFTSGLHADYHRVTDEPLKIDYDKLARVTELIWRVGVAVGERSESVSQ
ncbi:MAG TPA: M28 family peptidase [Gemmatimonadaceae bacterium]